MGTDREFYRVAVFGGVYNNYLALESLLGQCKAIGVDAIFCLGDVGGFGPHPDRCFPLLKGAAVRTIAGNYDISLAEGREDCGCGYTDPRDNYFAQISYDYTFKNTALENRQWLGTLAPFARFKLGPLSVYLCHGSPRQTNEFLWESSSPDHLLHKFIHDCEADVICCSHTGLKWHRQVEEGKHFINTGVIGRPENDGDTRVWFTLLEYTSHAFRYEFRPLLYDHDQLSLDMRQEGLPQEFIETIKTGWWTCCLEAMPSRERLRGKF